MSRRCHMSFIFKNSLPKQNEETKFNFKWKFNKNRNLFKTLFS